MCIYICSVWAGETRFLAPSILVWDQLVLARVLHGEYCGESLGSAGGGGAQAATCAPMEDNEWYNMTDLRSNNSHTLSNATHGLNEAQFP